MSRGHGHVERAVLDALQADCWLSIAELATIVYDQAEPTTSQLVAVRRAVRTLKAAGRVHASYWANETPRTTVERQRWDWRAQEFQTFTVDVPAPLLYVRLEDEETARAMRDAVAEARALLGRT